MNKNNKKAQKSNSGLSNVRRSTDEDIGINTDPLGSWTGVPADPYEKPTQDADDL